MKRLSALIFAVLILFTACKKEETTLTTVDYNDALVLAETLKTEVTLSDDTTGDAYMKIPALNVNLDGANALSDKIAEDMNNAYGEYFKSPDDTLVRIDYSYSEKYDIISVLLTCTVTYPGDGEYTKNYAYYYDALSDVELDMTEYVNCCGSQMALIYDALLTSDWAKDYEAKTGNAPDDEAIAALVCVGENLFDAYCNDIDTRSDSLIALSVDDDSIDLSGIS